MALNSSIKYFEDRNKKNKARQIAEWLINYQNYTYDEYMWWSEQREEEEYKFIHIPKKSGENFKKIRSVFTDEAYRILEEDWIKNTKGDPLQWMRGRPFDELERLMYHLEIEEDVAQYVLDILTKKKFKVTSF